MSAKSIIVKPISSKDAARIVKSCHYSGKVVPNSQLHFGVFLDGKCGGAMQFGPSMRKDLIRPLVSGTGWNGFIELNRMAFADWLPRNSESRAIAVAMRLIRKSYPHIEWIVSFADGTQCGDGTIYRASGFDLIGIKKNTELVVNPRNGETMATMAAYHKGFASEISTWEKLSGHMLRYIYFLNPSARSRLTVPILPFIEIQRRGAGMYLGKPKRAGSDTSDTPAFQAGKGGSLPTPALHSQPFYLPMKIEQIQTADLIPYARNTRTHSEAQVAQIAGSIREFGFTNPILIDAENSIIAGHGRVMAAQKLGLDKVPCIRLAHLTDTQKRAYIIADNKLALNAGWDEEMLGLELADLREADFDLDVLGFDNFAIEQFLNPPERNDEAPESSGGEIDVDAMEMGCACPKCGFEFDPKKP